MNNNKVFYFLLVLFIFILLGTFASCSKTPNRIGVDGYYFEEESFTHKEFAVEIVLVQSDDEMAKLFKEMKNVQGEVEAKNVAAFSSIRSDGRCKIYMIDPKIRYVPQWYGHELVHCVYGVWHKEPQAGR